MNLFTTCLKECGSRAVANNTREASSNWTTWWVPSQHLHFNSYAVLPKTSLRVEEDWFEGVVSIEDHYFRMMFRYPIH